MYFWRSAHIKSSLCLSLSTAWPQRVVMEVGKQQQKMEKAAREITQIGVDFLISLITDRKTHHKEDSTFHKKNSNLILVSSSCRSSEPIFSSHKKILVLPECKLMTRFCFKLQFPFRKLKPTDNCIKLKIMMISFSFILIIFQLPVFPKVNNRKSTAYMTFVMLCFFHGVS